MYIIRFTQFFQVTMNYKNLAFFVFPNANLKPDFQKYVAFGEVSKPRTRVLIRVTHRRRTTIFAMRIHHTLPLATDHIWQDSELTDIGSPTKLFCHLFVSIVLKLRWREIRSLCQRLYQSPAMRVAVDPSVEQPPANLTYVIKSTNAYV